MTTESDRQMLRNIVRNREDFQAIRKRIDSRIGRKADGKPQNVEARIFRIEDLAYLEHNSDQARKIEEEGESKLQELLDRFPIYTEYLSKIKGLGTVAAAKIISSFDINIATTASKMTAYAGLNPGMIQGKKQVKKSDYKESDGEAVGEKGEYYIVLTNELIRGDKCTKGFISPYNKNLKTALVGVLADNFIKAGLRWEPISEEEYKALDEMYRSRREKKIDGVKKKDVPCKMSISSPYVKEYINYKNRLAHSTDTVSERVGNGKTREVMWKDATPKHRDMAAKRKMIKLFLQDLYAEWRKIEGLPVRPPYAEEFLGKVHEG